MLSWFAVNKDALAGMASVFSMAGTVFAVLIFLSGLYQYTKAERWKRSEYVAKLYSELANDPDAVHAIWMIDGDDRKMFFEEGDKHRPYDIDQAMVTKALREYSPGKEFSQVELHIRNSFDVFFTYVEEFDRAIENKLIEKDDAYAYFRYWIGLFNSRRKDPDEEKLRTQILEYVDVIGYRDVRRFFNRWRHLNPA